MAKLGGWWLKSDSLGEGEELIVKYPTNYFYRDSRPLGGRLYLTDQRLVFLPHFLDALLGGDRTSIDLDDIAEVREETPDDRPEGRSRRVPPRLQVDTRDGESHLFVIDGIEAAIERVNEQRGSATD